MSLSDGVDGVWIRLMRHLSLHGKVSSTGPDFCLFSTRYFRAVWGSQQNREEGRSRVLSGRTGSGSFATVGDPHRHLSSPRSRSLPVGHAWGWTLCGLGTRVKTCLSSEQESVFPALRCPVLSCSSCLPARGTTHPLTFPRSRVVGPPPHTAFLVGCAVPLWVVPAHSLGRGVDGPHFTYPSAPRG